MTLPLAGKRLIVTRARRQASQLVEALAASGAEVILLPAIELAPPQSFEGFDLALRRIDDFDWLILTSTNTVDAMAQRMKVFEIDPAGLDLAVAAIGPATARSAAEAGLRVEVVPGKHVAEALVRDLESRMVGRRVFYPRAEGARDVIPQGLAAAGAAVTVADAYRTVMPEESVAKIRGFLTAGSAPPSGVLFTSSSTVTNFLRLLDAAGFPAPPPWEAISIGPITSATLRNHGWPPAAEAREATIPALVEACIPVPRRA